jgi:plasmid stabilization system protein ParE
MRFRIVWTDHAVEELTATLAYLRSNFTDREVHRLTTTIDNVLKYISEHPHAFPASEHEPNVRRALITRHNTLYYRADEMSGVIEILSFFLNRKQA